jgi:hypothetical protein
MQEPLNHGRTAIEARVAVGYLQLDVKVASRNEVPWLTTYPETFQSPKDTHWFSLP